ncbi:hypothetical protein N7447_011227 [Penicillium robsamsonii]|nr:hypothetical protein N7447_011227 [Penicillium robsamsonii]
MSGVKPVREVKANGGGTLTGAPSTDPGLRMDLSKSVAVGTRKMVNYA